MPPDPNQLTIEDRQRKRQADRKSRSQAFLGFDFDAPAEILDIASDDVHADPAARDVRDRIGGRKPRLEDKLVDSILGERLVLANDPLLTRAFS